MTPAPGCERTNFRFVGQPSGGSDLFARPQPDRRRLRPSHPLLPPHTYHRLLRGLPTASPSPRRATRSRTSRGIARLRPLPRTNDRPCSGRWVSWASRRPWLGDESAMMRPPKRVLMDVSRRSITSGGVPEWLKGPVSKTGVAVARFGRIDRSSREVTSRLHASVFACHHLIMNGCRSQLLRCRRTEARNSDKVVQTPIARLSG